jgi:hypothetical protein
VPDAGLVIPQIRRCALCFGTGVANLGDGPENCPDCDGEGVVSVSAPRLSLEEEHRPALRIWRMLSFARISSASKIHSV